MLRHSCGPLAEIGDKVRLLEPKRGDYLLWEAERLAEMTGIPVPEIRAELPNNDRRPESAVGPT